LIARENNYLKRISKSIAPFGFRHELAKRYTPVDWVRSLKVKKSINHTESDHFIYSLITSNKSGLVGRLGGTEGRFLGEYLKLKRLERIGIPITLSAKLSPRWRRRRAEVFLQAGFYFEDWQEVEEFCTEYLDALELTNVLGAWGVAFTWVEGINLDTKSTQVIPVGFTAPWVEPYVTEQKPWALALEGKKVLVVSGFAESISSQHKRISKVFENVEYPNFELQVVRAPIVAGARDLSGKSWLDLLGEMKKSISDLDFDIALIAAGAFSYPLAAHVKKIGKIGIHCGGGLQLFFGVMGNRWKNSPEVLKYVNENWVRPSKSETPPSADEIENACYW
jgi:hypothetical protein